MVVLRNLRSYSARCRVSPLLRCVRVAGRRVGGRGYVNTCVKHGYAAPPPPRSSNPHPFTYRLHVDPCVTVSVELPKQRFMQDSFSIGLLQSAEG